MGDRLRTDKPPRYIINRPGQLSLLPSAGREMSNGQSALALRLESKGRHGSFHLWSIVDARVCLREEFLSTRRYKNVLFTIRLGLYDCLFQ